MKSSLSKSAYTYVRRIAGAHGYFAMEDFKKWMEQADTEGLAAALRRLAKLSQRKAYLFWENFN